MTLGGKENLGGGGARNEVVLDLETKRAPEGWGSRENLGSLGISVVGIWTSGDDQFRVYREGDITELGPLFQSADRVIGFAIHKFDLPVLQPYLDFNLRELPTLDIFEDLCERLGHRVSLASLAKATLGASKLGHGLEAVQWYRDGEWQKLEEYCLQDVRITRDLYRFGQEHGHLLFESFVDRNIVSVPVSWGMPDVAVIRATIARANAERKAMEIDYISRENAGEGYVKTRKIELKAVREDEIEAYDHLRRDVRLFRIGRIAGARILDEFIQPRPVEQTLFGREL